MNRVLLTLSALLSLATASVVPEIAMESDLGQHLMSQARRLDQNGDDQFENSYSWVADYSMKFQGCHHIKQWNDNVDEDNDVRISTKRLIRFRLCPSGSCSNNKAAGCSGGYGDYIIDMDTFMQAYMEAKKRSIEYNCEYYLTYSCSCNDDDGQGDDFNREYCEYDCFNDAGMTECIDQNPYEDDQNQQEFNVEEYMECRQLNVDNNNNRRKLEEGANDDQQEEAQYFVGPYCAAQGGEVRLGLFSDDSCTEFYDSVSFYDLMGFELPYKTSSIVGSDCLECVEKQDVNEQQNGDAQDEDNVSESCENLYLAAGKCEANLPYGMVSEPNTKACNYMEGIRIVREDGIVDTAVTRPSAVATAFIVIFSMAFCAMAFYVWYLRTRLGVKNTLL